MNDIGYIYGYRKCMDMKWLRNLETLRNPSAVKTIHKNHKLASGSNSMIFMNNTASGFLRVSTVTADVSYPCIS